MRGLPAVGSDRGIALVLTMAIVLLFVVLVAGFYQVVIGRHRWAHKRSANTESFYKAEAGLQDANARLWVGRRDPAAAGAIDPSLLAALVYCLDIDASPPAQVACGSGTDDVQVTVQPRDANGLNQIQAAATY